MTNYFQYANFASFNGSFSTLSSDSFTIVHGNIRSIRESWDESIIVIAEIGDLIDAIVLTEINVNLNTLSELRLRGFDFFFFYSRLARRRNRRIHERLMYSNSDRYLLHTRRKFDGQGF